MTNLYYRWSKEFLEPKHDRPRIQIQQRQLKEVLDDLAARLHETNDPPRLFPRSGRFVRVLRGENGRPYINEVSVEVLLEMFSRVVTTVTSRTNDCYLPQLESSPT